MINNQPNIKHEKIHLLFLIVSMGFACSEKQNTENQYVIITNKEADSISQRAALQLQDYWFRISDKRIDIKQKPVTKFIPIYIGKSFLNSSQKTSLQKLKDDGFLVRIHEDAVYLAGKILLEIFMP